MKNIMVTGGGGFVGSFLLNNFNIHTQVVRNQNKKNFRCRNTFQVESICGNTNWNGAFDNVDSIIHLAGLAHSSSFSREDYQAVNVDGALHLAKEAAIAGVKRFVFVSSIGVNGSSTEKSFFSPASPANPHNPYAQSKLNAELGLKKIAQESGLEVVIVRSTLVYGANAPGNFGLLTKLVVKLPLLPFGLVDNKRDFIAVQNLVDLLIACAKHPGASGHTFLASDGETVSIREFTNAIAKGLNKSLVQIPIPNFLMRLGARMLGKSAMAEQLLGNLQVDSSNAQEVLGWTPPYTMKESMVLLKEQSKERE